MTRAIATTFDGRPCCQAFGCTEAAKPWGYVVDYGPVEVVVLLCARHEAEARGKPSERVGA